MNQLEQKNSSQPQHKNNKEHNMCLPVSRYSLARLFIFQHTQKKKRERTRSTREWGRGSEQSERFILVPTPSSSKLPPSSVSRWGQLILVPIALFASLCQRGLGTRIEENRINSNLSDWLFENKEILNRSRNVCVDCWRENMKQL